MKRTMYNVASGPAFYPKEVLDKIANGIINYNGYDISTLEIGHRTKQFIEIRDELISLTKEILQIPEGFSVMYLQGGGRIHFAQIAMNFLKKGKKIQVIDTGYWSTKAAEYSNFYGEVELLSSVKNNNYSTIPQIDTSNLNGEYLQYCSNNTIWGTQFHEWPTSNIPTVVDMSSDIFSRAINFDKVDLLLACAQKNFGPAGLSLIVIKNNFLEKVSENIPPVFSYKNLASNNSNYNTPPIFQLCASLEMLRWIKDKGGVALLGKKAKNRAKLLYDTIDYCKLVTNNILSAERSTMNIVFDAVDEKFSNELFDHFSTAGITGFKGHKQRGGFRIGNYVGQSQNNIEQVCNVLRQFAQ